MTGWRVLSEKADRFTVLIRTWRPGDGIRCTFASRAGSEIPCGRPVAVKKVIDERRDAGTPTPPRNLVVCANHLADAIRPCDIRNAADQAARQALIVEHWEQYKRLLKDEVQTRLNELCEGLPSEIQEIALAQLEDDGVEGRNPA